MASRQPGAKRKKFGQHPPPVSKLIKNILDRYPDGQIFKVGERAILLSYLLPSEAQHNNRPWTWVHTYS